MLNFSLDDFAALLFDLDGTLADSMSLHNQAWIQTLAAEGLTITADILHEYTGVPTLKTVPLLNQRFGWHLQPEQIAAKKEKLFLATLDQIRPIEPVVKIAKASHGRMPIAVVSGGIRENVKKTLQAIGLEDIFPLLVCADDTILGKPHPDPFLLAANQLQAEAKSCLVFEDGVAGIQAARAAGMSIVRVSADFQLKLIEDRRRS